MGNKNNYPGQVRIIGGEWRGRRLNVIDSPGFRPTPDRVKETVFNWLQPHLPGSRCLDLFAGSGALCLESLSRGAREVVMIEKDPNVLRNLAKNVDMLKTPDARLLNSDAIAFLAGRAEPFDIVFVDPPFSHPDLINQSIAQLHARGWLSPGALVYVEAPSSFDDLVYPDDWSILKSKKAGQVGYYLLQTSTG